MDAMDPSTLVQLARAKLRIMREEQLNGMRRHRIPISFGEAHMLLAHALLLPHDEQPLSEASTSLEEAISNIDHAIALTKESDEHFADVLAVYAKAYLGRFKIREDPAIIDQITSKLDKFASVVKSNDMLLHVYAIATLNRYRATNHVPDLETGIERLERLRLRSGVELDIRQTSLSTLAEFYPYMYEKSRDGGEKYLDLAVESGEEAVRLVPSESATAATAFIFGSASSAYYWRYHHQRSSKDVETAIEYSKRALDLAGSDSLAARDWQNILGLCYYLRAETMGDLSDLKTATDIFDALIAVTAEGSPQYMRRVNNLANALGRRFEWTGDTDALDLGITKLRLVCGSERHTSVETAETMRNLSLSLIHRYRYHNHETDVEEAISWLRKAVSLLPSDHIEILHAKSILCNVLSIRFEISKPRNEAYIDEAIRCGTEAVSTSATGSPFWPEFLSNLASAYKHRYSKSKAEEDLSKSIRYMADAIEASRETSPDLALLCFLHSVNLFERALSWSPGRPSDFEEALCYSKRALESENGRPLSRIGGARLALLILGEFEMWEEAATLGMQAMDVLPLHCGRSLSLKDQQRSMTMISSLASELCSILLQLGRPEAALQQLEAGRGVVLGYRMNNEHELAALRNTNKDLAKRFESLRDKLRMASRQGWRSDALRERDLRHRGQVEDHMTDCLNAIRKLDGHMDFLRPPSLNEMKASSANGSIVLVNVTKRRSDAIIVTQSKIFAVPLPDLRPDTVELQGFAGTARGSDDYEGIEEAALNRAGRVVSVVIPSDRPMTPPLEKLWHSCVLPVLDALEKAGVMSTDGGEVGKNGRQLPRIWWIGCGAATSLPFHAAGDGSGNDALSRMIPSYTPSIKVLLHSRQRSRLYMDALHAETGVEEDGKRAPRLGIASPAAGNAVSAWAPQLALITMRTTPGYDELPGVVGESEAVVRACGKRFTYRELPQPCVRDALAAVAEVDMVHFACHGEASTQDPSKSCLVLQQTPFGPEPPPPARGPAPIANRLTVAGILERLNGSDEDGVKMALRHRRRAWLAYLSACSTSTTRSAQLADEALHISGALQVAGFTHVVGSLWNVKDKVCVALAEAFYTALVEAQELCDAAVAEALRTAVLQVRSKYPSWQQWGAYIHLGA